MWSIWRCWDCGYQGAVVVEDKELADEIRKNFLEKIKNEETGSIEKKYSKSNKDDIKE